MANHSPNRHQVDKLAGRVGIVTGGGGLIGSETCRVLAEAGATVVIPDINEEAAKSVADEINAQGGAALALGFDLSYEDSIVEVVRTAVAEFGRIDFVHNNFAPLQLVWQDAALVDMPVEIWDETIITMLRSQMLMSRYAIPHLIEAGGGSIVNMSSIQALMGDRTMPAYSSAKAAIVALSRSIASQYGHQGVRCNVISPGHISSQRVIGEARERLVRQQLLNRLGEPIDIANAVLFLASDDSKFITGQTFIIDGGMTVHLPTYADGGTIADIEAAYGSPD